MTGSEFRDYVVNKFVRTDKDTEIYQATTDVLAEINRKIKGDDYAEEAYVAGITTIGEYKIALPSDFGSIVGTISITDTTADDYYTPLNKISKQEYDDLYPDRLLTAVGNMHKDVPRDFCIYAEQIYLGPVPDKTTYRYQINYTTENIAEIASGTANVPYTSLNHRNMLRNGVLFELHDGLENFDEAAYYKSLFLNGVDELIRYENNIKRAGSSGVAYHGI